MFTSKSQTWNTPNWLFEGLDKCWKFDVDAACIESSARCKEYYTPDNSALDKDWDVSKVHFCNPPYDDIRTWMEKCLEQYNRGCTIVTLIPSRTDTNAFHSSVFGKCSGVCFIKGRLKFNNPLLGDEGKNSAPFPSCLVIYDKNLSTDKIEYLNSIGYFMKC